MTTDWMRELDRLKWAVGSLTALAENGSSAKEILENSTRGITGRIDWIIEQAKAETKREPRA